MVCVGAGSRAVGLLLVSSLVSSAASSQSVRDSAGVQIVTSERPMLPAARAWRIEPVPMLRIGGDDAPDDSLYEFSLVMGVARMQDGRWAIGVQGSHTIRFYGADGKFVSSAGRKGEGPGEFQQILGMAITPGDTLVVMDNGEVEYFDNRGRFVRQGASRRNMGPAGYVWPAGILPGGEFVGFNWNDRTPGPNGVILVPFLRVARTLPDRDTISVVPIAIYADGVDVRYGGPIPFTPRSAVTSSASRYWYGFGREFEVREYDLSNRIVRLVRRSFTPQPVRQAERDGYVAHAKAARERDKMHPLSPAMREASDRALANLPFPRDLPAFADIKADRSGNLWVEHYDWHVALLEPGPSRIQTMSVPSRWDVFDPSGRWLCSVDLPARFTPLEIGSDYVAGLARDEDEVERVDIYRLRKP